MDQLCIGNYIVDIFKEPCYSYPSTDNAHKYDDAYIAGDDYQCSTSFGIKIYENDTVLRSVLIGAEGGATGINKNAFVYESDRIIICCSDTVFCLSIPDLALLWKAKADFATCFEIFKYKTDYIVHGELQITRLGKDGEIIWQQSGADIFVCLNSTKDDFVITENYILATDWENRKYKFDFDGNPI